MQREGLRTTGWDPAWRRIFWARQRPRGRSRNLSLALLVMAGLALPACTPSAPSTQTIPGGETAGIREEYLWTKTVPGPFQKVLDNVRIAVSTMNFPVINERDYEKSFKERFRQLGEGTLPFQHYRIIETCNLMLALEALKTDPRMGAFLPCRIILFQELNQDTVTLLSVNPEFMHQALKNTALAPVAKQVGRMVESVFELAGE